MSYGTDPYGTSPYGSEEPEESTSPVAGTIHPVVHLAPATPLGWLDTIVYVYENVGVLLVESEEGIAYAYENVGFGLPARQTSTGILTSDVRNPRYGVAYVFENVLKVYDSFNRTADPSSLGIADTGQTWVLRPWFPWDGSGITIAQSTSVLGTNGTKAYSTDDLHGQIATIDYGSGDATVSVDVDITTLADGTGVGVAFRWQDATHFWTAQIYNGVGVGNASLLIQKQSGSTFAGRTLWSDVIGTLSSSIGRVEVVLSGSSIIANYYDDGTLVGTVAVTDSAFASATHHGINTYFSHDSVIDSFAM